MATATCLVNSQRREYLLLRDITTETRSFYLRELGRGHGWDIGWHDIYICPYHADFAGFKRVTHICIDTGGEVIEEWLT